VDKGMSAVAIDLSMDGENWTEFGTYNWSLAPGSDGYGGFSGPNFQGLMAQYVLITSLDAGSACKGLGKVAFSAVKCPVAGTLCDDGDPLSFGDVYDNNCECKGSAFDVNDCGETEVILGDTILNTSKFSAIDSVQSISDIAPDSRVSFVGGRSILLQPGFETTGETYFIASIDPCETPAAKAFIQSRAQIIAKKAEQREKDKIAILSVRDLTDDLVEVSYFIDKPGKATLGIFNSEGDKIFSLIDHVFKNQGLYKKVFRKKKLGEGEIEVRLSSENLQYAKEIKTLKR